MKNKTKQIKSLSLILINLMSHNIFAKPIPYSEENEINQRIKSYVKYEHVYTATISEIYDISIDETKKNNFYGYDYSSFIEKLKKSTLSNHENYFVSATFKINNIEPLKDKNYNPKNKVLNYLNSGCFETHNCFPGFECSTKDELSNHFNRSYKKNETTLLIFENESDLKFEIINDRNLFLVEGLKEFDKKYTLNYGENGYDIFGFDYFGYDKEGFNNKGYSQQPRPKGRSL